MRILAAFLISIAGKCTDIFPHHPFCPLLPPYLSGNISAIRIIHQTHDRHQQGILHKTGIFTVVMICHGNQADPQPWQDLPQQIACLNIFSSKTRQVLAQDTVKFSSLCSAHHCLKAGTLVVAAADTVIDPLTDTLHLFLLFHIL